MRNEEWQRVEELLDAALELAPAERRTLLEEIGATEPELRREIESLLVCEDQVDGFLGAPALAFSADFFDDDDTGEERAGQTVGHYRIIREIGRGGMGAVFLAERSDGEFQQEVALKVVRRSFADSELARRFRRERQILASLNHPNIARLLDGGVSADGEPFFAMEYVEGTRIDEHCELRQLSTRDRLKLFLSVCHGVSYAHQHLVIHRDIKPSNILVTADNGVPKLLDFGIAKLLDPDGPDMSHEHTHTGMRAFTPDYASPEQVSGAPVTTASDVYSLGVLLRDLLRGERTAKNLARVPGGWRSRSLWRTVTANLHTKQEYGDQESKSRIQNFLNAELENIIALARREDPTRRYASAAELAEDVQRFLDGRTVRAQKDSFTYRAGKFIRRNKITAGALVVVALSLVVGLAVSLWQANVARQERDRAEQRFNDVRQLSNALLSDIAPKIERLPGSTEARQALVSQSLKYLDSLARESTDDLNLQAELASAYEKVGDLQGNPLKPNLGDFANAISSYEKANRIRRNLPATIENQTLLADNFLGLANIRYVQEGVKAALPDYAEALKIFESLLANNPESDEVRIAYLKTSFEIAETYLHNNQFSVASVRLREIIAALEKLDLTQVETRQLSASAYAQLGNALSWDGKQSEAEIEMTKAVAIAERLAAENPNDTGIRHSVYKVYILASSIYEDTNYELSLDFAHRALNTAQKAVAADAADVLAKYNLAKSFSRVGVISQLLKRHRESIANLTESEKTFLELLEREPANQSYQRDLGVLYTRFGDAKEKQGDLQGSLQAFHKSVDYFEKTTQADEKNTLDRRNLAQSLKSAGNIHLKLSERGKASENFHRALELLKQLRTDNALGEFDKRLFAEVQVGLQTAEGRAGKE